MITKHIYDEYKTNLLSGNRMKCAGITKDLLSGGITVKELYLDLFQAAMYETGYLWEENIITPAVEHMASSITEYCMTFAYPVIFGSGPKEKKAIVSCVTNEYHQIGAKMAADFFELNGWSCYFVGANTPADDFMELIKDKEPEVVGISMSMYFNMPHFVDIIKKINSRFQSIKIIAGGQGLKNLTELPGSEQNVFMIKNIDELEKYLNEHN